MVRRRILVGVALLATLVAVSAGPSGASDLADAKARQRKLQRQLDDATKELAQLENERHWAAQSLADARGRLGSARDGLLRTQRSLGAQAASLYKAGGTRPLSSILSGDSDVVVGRMEFETIMIDRQMQAVADARVAYDTYQRAIKDVQAAQTRIAGLERQAAATTTRLAKAFEKAKQVTDKLSGFAKTLLIDGRFYACPVSPPYSYIDSWGFARSGGRRHQGTDIMNAYGNKIHAYVDGVISRFSTNSLGGITLYLEGDDGNEYYYAHLSRYASRVGQRVKAGELIAYNGASGNARFSGPHLHFEVHPGGGAPVNPYPWVKRTCL